MLQGAKGSELRKSLFCSVFINADPLQRRNKEKMMLCGKPRFQLEGSSNSWPFVHAVSFGTSIWPSSNSIISIFTQLHRQASTWGLRPCLSLFDKWLPVYEKNRKNDWLLQSQPFLCSPTISKLGKISKIEYQHHIQICCRFFKELIVLYYR